MNVNLFPEISGCRGNVDMIKSSTALFIALVHYKTYKMIKSAWLCRGITFYSYIKIDSPHHLANFYAHIQFNLISFIQCIMQTMCKRSNIVQHKESVFHKDDMFKGLLKQ